MRQASLILMGWRPIASINKGGSYWFQSTMTDIGQDIFSTGIELRNVYLQVCPQPPRKIGSSFQYWNTFLPRGQARIQGFFGGWSPPPYGCLQFLLLVDLPRALQQFGSAPEIPVRTPPPPPPSESWIRAWRRIAYMVKGRQVSLLRG